MKHTTPRIFPMCIRAKGRMQRPFALLGESTTRKKEIAAGLCRGEAANEASYLFQNPTGMRPTTQALMLYAANEVARSIPGLPKAAKPSALRMMFNLIYAGLGSEEDQNG